MSNVEEQFMIQHLGQPKEFFCTDGDGYFTTRDEATRYTKYGQALNDIHNVFHVSIMAGKDLSIVKIFKVNAQIH